MDRYELAVFKRKGIEPPKAKMYVNDLTMLEASALAEIVSMDQWMKIRNSNLPIDEYWPRIQKEIIIQERRQQRIENPRVTELGSGRFFGPESLTPVVQRAWTDPETLTTSIAPPVTLNFTPADLTMSMDDFTEQRVSAHAQRLAEIIDRQLVNDINRYPLRGFRD